MSGYIIKAVIEDTHPPVWRRIVIPDRISFGNLHRILQTAFQWEDAHMHDFSFPGAETRVVMKGQGDGVDVEEDQTFLDRLLKSCKFIRYTYDFGDEWRQKIIFEKEDKSYKARYATVIKYKGDSFEEDSGGVWDGDGEYRVSFDMPSVNEELQGMSFPVKKEGKKSKELIDDIEAEKMWTGLSKKMSLGKLEKVIKEMVKENPLSEMEKKLGKWELLCETMDVSGQTRIMKNISRKSSVELLSQMSLNDIRKQCKYIGAEIKEWDDTWQCAEKFMDELKRDPSCLAYIFDWEELKELMGLIHAPNSECGSVPGRDVIAKAMILGLFDLSEEMVNRNQYTVFRQTKEAAELIDRYTQDEWRCISKKSEKLVENCNYLMNMYSMIEVNTFCKKYHEYFDASASEKELRRAIYLRGTFCGELTTAEAEDGAAYVAQYYINMNRVGYEQQEEAIDIEYREFSSEERKKFSDGYGGMYPIWAEYYDFLVENYGMDDGEAEEYLQVDYCNVKNGDGAEILWEYTRESIEMPSIECYVRFWMLFLGVCLTTGLPKYNGYSREEYAGIKGIPLTDMGIYRNWKPSDKITKKTHLYEMPLELQLRVFESVKEPSGEKKAEALEALVQELHGGNYELEYMLCGVLLDMEDTDKAEKYVQKLQKAFPKDEEVKLLSDTLHFENSFKTDEEEFSVWDMMEGKIPKSNVTTYKRELPKVGRNDPCPCGSGKKYKKCCGK